MMKSDRGFTHDKKFINKFRDRLKDPDNQSLSPEQIYCNLLQEPRLEIFKKVQLRGQILVSLRACERRLE